MTLAHLPNLDRNQCTVAKAGLVGIEQDGETGGVAPPVVVVSAVVVVGSLAPPSPSYSLCDPPCSQLQKIGSQSRITSSI